MFFAYRGLSRRFTYNDLRASEGRETKAPNNKPITNLKEKSELSNYCKTSGFRLHAVSACSLHLGLQIISITILHSAFVLFFVKKVGNSYN